MARITQLPNASALAGTEMVPVVQFGQTRKSTIGALVAAAVQPFINIAQGWANTAGLAAATALAATNLHPSAAEGLAATADGSYFAVAGTGEIYATLYRRVGAAANVITIYPSKQALDRIGTTPALTVEDMSVDNAPAIQAALNDPLVRKVLLPPGVIWTRQTITVPSGKTIEGCGQDVTIVRAHPTIFADAGGFQSIIRSAKEAKGVVVRNLTADVNKTTGNGKMLGIMMWCAQDFLVESVTAMNSTGYSFWAMSTFGDLVKPCGTFRKIKSYNSNVHFECSRGDGVLFDDMEYGPGAGTIGAECVYHALSGARNVTFRNGRGYGSGTLISILANENEDVENIQVINCQGEQTGTQYLGIQIEATYGNAQRALRNIQIINCDVTSSGNQGMKIDDADVRFRGGRYRFTTPQAVTLGEGAVVSFEDVELKVTETLGNTAYAFLATSTSRMSYTGGSIWYDAVNIATSTSAKIRISPTTTILRGPNADQEIVGECPTGIGQVVRRVSKVDQSPISGQALGSNTFAFVAAIGARYRIRLLGMITAGAGAVGVRFNATFLGGTDNGHVSGRGSMSRATDGGAGAHASPIFSLVTNAPGNTVMVPAPGAGQVVHVELDAVLSAGDGQYYITLQGLGDGTMARDAYFEVERLA